MASSSSFRSEIYKGPITVSDSVVVSPFRNKYLVFPDVPIGEMQQLSSTLAKLNAHWWAHFIFVGDLNDGSDSYDLIAGEFDAPKIIKALKAIRNTSHEPVSERYTLDGKVMIDRDRKSVV